MRNMEQAAIPRSVAMKLTGHRTENVYRRYAIVSPADLQAAALRWLLTILVTIAGRQLKPVAQVCNIPAWTISSVG